MSGYFARLARQSGIGLGPAAEPPVSESGATPDPVEIHEERESIPAAPAAPTASPANMPDAVQRQGSPKAAPATTSPPERAAPVLPIAQADTPARAQPAVAAERPQLERPSAQQSIVPAAPVTQPRVQPELRQSRQALHLDAVHQVVEWIAAAPLPAPLPSAAAAATRTIATSAATRATAVAATRAIAAALPIAEQIEEQVVWPPAAPALPGARAVEQARAAKPERTEADPSTESLSVSIGSIQVTVEAPPQPAAAPVQHAPPAPSPASSPAPSRLRRHYLRLH